MAERSISDNFKECVTKKYAQFEGRADRAEFWQFFLAAFVINVATLLLGGMMSGTIIACILLALYYIFNLAILVPTLAVGVRRMHDIGKGGGWVCINLIPLIGSIVFLVMAAKESEPAPNRFG